LTRRKTPKKAPLRTIHEWLLPETRRLRQRSLPKLSKTEQDLHLLVAQGRQDERTFPSTPPGLFLPPL